MKLTVHKLGRITDAELDIKPLTVFSGHNGTNKTWLAWAMFKLLLPVSTNSNGGGFLLREESPNPFSKRIHEKLKPLFDSLGQDNATATVSLELEISDLLDENEVICESNREELAALLSADSSLSMDSHVRLSFRVNELNARKKALRVEFESGLGRLSITSIWQLAKTVLLSKTAAASPDWDERKIFNTVLGFTQQYFLRVFCLPADRAGLLLAAEAGQTGLALPEPLSEFLGVMSLMRTARRESPLKDQLLPFLSHIAGGEVRLSGAKGEERLVLDVSGRPLPIAVASSLSRSVAGLSQYIRAFASPGDVLLIDELEMNAHPQAQLALVELMAVMVSYGIRIVFTTHSPYVIDHLNNLLEAGRAPAERQEKLAEEFQLRTRRAFLPADKVSVYAFEETPDGAEVKVTSAIDPATGLVTKSTFAPVTQKLSQLFNAALDASEDSA